MQIRVKLVGAFQIGRFKEQTCDFHEGTSDQDVATSLQLPEQILGIVLINGIHAEFEDQLYDGDNLTLLPVLDGG